MNTYNNMLIVIATGDNTKEELYSMIDVFLMRKRITSTQYNDLADKIEAKYPAPVEG